MHSQVTIILHGQLWIGRCGLEKNRKRAADSTQRKDHENENHESQMQRPVRNIAPNLAASSFISSLTRNATE